MYYKNNSSSTLTLLEAITDKKNYRISNGKLRPMPIVFSSTCATYGIPIDLPITEDHPQSPINPYGNSKKFVEQMIKDCGIAYDLPSVIFRYFNAAGADPQGDLGEDHSPETHIIPLVISGLTDQSKPFRIFGTDYSTPDGTCIRDYIHVSDLADAHVLGLKKLEHEHGQFIYNLGNGNGYSVREVISAAENLTNRQLDVEYVARREGDPSVLVADASYAKENLGWKPQYTELSEMLRHAYKWFTSKQTKE